MRTSTVIFLVIFLCLFSSSDRRSHLREIVDHLREGVHELTEPCERHAAPCPAPAAAVEVEESHDTRALRGELEELAQRSEAADKTMRAVDRSVRTLDDRIRKLEREMRKQPEFEDVFESSLTLLQRQRAELLSEKDEIQALKERIQGQAIRVQAQLDLASIRSERREVEAFLNRERGSPLEKLARETDWTTH